MEAETEERLMPLHKRTTAEMPEEAAGSQQGEVLRTALGADRVRFGSGCVLLMGLMEVCDASPSGSL